MYSCFETKINQTTTGIILILLCLFSKKIIAQTDSSSTLKRPVSIYLRNIIIEGNIRTKDFIILRHLTIAPGDSLSLSDIPGLFEENKSNLVNLQLFIDVQFNLKNWEGKQTDIYITVKERWYSLPMISFDIYDRNFNSWWVTHNADLRRVQYGGRFLQQNVRGRDEELYVILLNGFAQRIEAGYNMPYINKGMSLGLRARIYANRNRTLQYYNLDNKEQFYWDDNKYLRTSYGGSLDFTIRPGIRFRQVLSVSYNYASINDSIYRLNSFYFDSAKTQQYIGLRYTVINDNRDWAAYPLKGSYTEATINKTGVGKLLSTTDLTALYLIYARYIPLSAKWFSSVMLRSKISFPIYQPYYNQRGLGYKSDYVSGYEYYIIDAQSYALVRANVRYRLYRLRIPVMNPFMKTNNYMPVYFYPKLLLESGYALDQTSRTDNPLSNTLLRSIGLGVDIATGYDFVFRVEYSLNHRLEKGLYLHFSGLF
jgi:outer membrane protein assembly factor BamA